MLDNISKINLQFLDYLVIAIYFAVTFIVAYRTKRKTNSSDYILAGRKLTLPFFVMSLVATWYGNILGVGEFVLKNGMLAFTCFCLPYYIAGIGYALFFAKRINKEGYTSIPELFQKHYGKNSSIVSTLFLVVNTIPSAYILVSSYILSSILSIDYIYSALILSFVSYLMIRSSGFNTTVVLNSIQFVFMYLGLITLFIFSYLTHGGISELWVNIIPKDRLIFSNTEWQVIASWFLVALQTFVDPNFHQRTVASVTPNTSKRGILISVSLWVVFDFLTISTAFYSKVYYNNSNGIDAYLSYSSTILQSPYLALLIIALFATAISTFESFANVSASMIAERKKFFDNNLKNFNFSLLIVMIVAILLSIFVKSPIDLIYYPSSIVIPGLILPTILAFLNKSSLIVAGILPIILISNIVSLIWLLLSKFTSIGIFQLFEPMIIGIITSFILSLYYAIKK